MSDQGPRRTAGLEALAVSVAAVTEPVFRRHGPALGRIVADWTSIAGERLAARTLPERLARPAGGGRDGEGGDAAGVLHVRVGSGAVAMELRHLEPAILDRIAASLGWRAVGRLRFVHGPLPGPRRERPAAAAPSGTTPADPETEEWLRSQLEGLGESELREALAALGRRSRASGTGARGRP